ncbi:uncharacterized protein LOC115623507 [Scaptodrosophila lebanonensis]|uniref:Uncharacterized protein LOC115623507 n=1 Tax=Drosophila lebanonensis TaxID=7225 RepID=A0A6J2TFG8_DROLE|nr:uncharacterized protein LOC115623507 [Scaptodrosophila lebanonensis]
MFARCRALIFYLLICLFARQTILVLGQVPIDGFCARYSGKDVNVTRFMGEWYEVARVPASNLSCVKTSLGVDAQQDIVNVNTSFSYAREKPFITYNMIGAVSVPNLAPLDLYNFSYTLENSVLPYTSYKLVATDYDDISFICGYQNTSGTTETFGFVLQRDPIIRSQNTSNFIAILGMSMIVQGSSCPGYTPTPSSPDSGSTLSFSLYLLLALISLHLLRK